MGETRVVKRYANRKLYDTQRSRYVTLEQIADMIRSGEDVKIVDNNSKEDLTAITLTQIIFEEEKKQSFLPLSALRNIIQSGATNITQFATQAGERVRGIFKREGGENGDGKHGGNDVDHRKASSLRSVNPRPIGSGLCPAPNGSTSSTRGLNRRSGVLNVAKNVIM